MKVWIYNGYDKLNDSIKDGSEIKEPVIFNEITPGVDYIDETSIDNIVKYGDKLANDYLQKRMWIIDHATVIGWVNLTGDEKDILIEYHAYDRNITKSDNITNKVIYLMGLGYTQQQAQGFLIVSFSKHHKKNVESCKLRASSLKVNEVVLGYLQEVDATDFTETSKTLFDLYITHARTGSNDNSERDGLFDFIESTGVYFNAGLKETGYILNYGTWDDFRTSLMDIFRNGNY